MKKFFSLLWQGWKKFAHVLGIINTRILLTVTYFVIIALASIGKLFGADLLDRRIEPAGSYWHKREPHVDTLETCKRQF